MTRIERSIFPVAKECLEDAAKHAIPSLKSYAMSRPRIRGRINDNKNKHTTPLSENATQTPFLPVVSKVISREE
jgi:hypothetical protein